MRRITLFASASLIAAMPLLAACGGSGAPAPTPGPTMIPSPTPTPGPTPTPTTTPTPTPTPVPTPTPTPVPTPTPTPTPTPPPINHAPSFTSAGSVSLKENTALSYQATASDADGDPLTFSISGGSDASKFSITGGGKLTLNLTPNFEKPQDSNGDNSYVVTLRVSDGHATASLALSVNVTNDKEGISVRRVAMGFTEPVFITPIPGSSHLLVVTKQGGVYDLTPGGSTAPALVLSVSSIGTAGEAGALAVAPAADYTATGRLYVYAVDSDADRTIEVRQYLGVGQGPSPTTYDTLLTIPHPTNDNHFGGWLAFGADGFLYAGVGDGGSGNDPPNNAQNTSVRLGKLLRMKVSTTSPLIAPAPGNPFIGGGGDPYVFAYGLRNPFRNSFYGSGILIGDVGQDAREEVDWLPTASGGGTNFGWHYREGTADNAAVSDDGPGGYTNPVTEYVHGSGPRQGNTIIGGLVYSGPIASLQDFYVFGDYIAGHIWSIPRATLLGGGTVSSSQYEVKDVDFAPNAGTLKNPVCFTADHDGNLWIVDYGGDIFEAVPG